MSDMYELFLKLNDAEGIVLQAHKPILSLYPCDQAIVKYYDLDSSYVLGTDCIEDQIADFYYLLEAALNNTLQQDKSITLDIGYEWNEVLQDKPGFVYNKIETTQVWVGLKNLMWSMASDASLVLNTWIYNDSQGAIILEVTPNYSWHMREPESFEQFISYEEWIKSYKPLLIRTIPREVALEWKDIAEKILKHIEKNTQEFDAAQPK